MTAAPPGEARSHTPRAILGGRARREAAIYILDVQIDVAGRASVEAVPGQMQLRRAAPQLHIQRPVWPEGVLGFDFEPELCVPVNACSRVIYVQDRGDTLHRSPSILGSLA
jgi:hypothetical protein